MDILSITGTVTSVIALVLAIFSTSWNNIYRIGFSILCVLLIIFLIYLLYYRIKSKKVTGEFEWQWAGENWLGYVKISVDENNTSQSIAKIKMEKVFKYGKPGDTMRPREQIKVFESSNPGSLIGDKDGFKLTLPIKRHQFDKNNKEIKPTYERLEAELKPAEAYVGSVNYNYEGGGQGSGDIILIRHRTILI